MGQKCLEHEALASLADDADLTRRFADPRPESVCLLARFLFLRPHATTRTGTRNRNSASSFVVARLGPNPCSRSIPRPRSEAAAEPEWSLAAPRRHPAASGLGRGRRCKYEQKRRRSV